MKASAKLVLVGSVLVVLGFFHTGSYYAAFEWTCGGLFICAGLIGMLKGY